MESLVYKEICTLGWLSLHYVSVSASSPYILASDFLRGQRQERTALGEMKCLPEFYQKTTLCGNIMPIAPLSPPSYNGAAPN